MTTLSGIDRAHRESIENSTSDVAKQLLEDLGPKLVSHMLNLADRQTVAAWATGDSNPRQANEDRLRDVFHIYSVLRSNNSKHTIRAWFIGMNPLLADESPASVIADGRMQDALIAAKSFVTTG